MTIRVGVIIGRFQCIEPHQGHIALFKAVAEVSDKCIILFGQPAIPMTDKNPLTYEMRAAPILHAFGKSVKGFSSNIIGAPVYDHPSDETWSRNVDEKIHELIHLYLLSFNTKVEITLYGSRDSFIPKYKGVHLCKQINTVAETSATKMRRGLVSLVDSSITSGNFGLYLENPMFKSGVIYAIEKRFPTVYSTVDIALLKLDNHYTKILLGRKPNTNKWCLPGGFVDPADSSIEVAAARELSEEVTGISTHEFKYVTSMKVNDYRYRDTKDSIMTHLFKTYILGGLPKAGDDLEEVGWFNLRNFKDHKSFNPLDFGYVVEAHVPILEIIWKSLKEPQ